MVQEKGEYMSAPHLRETSKKIFAYSSRSTVTT